MIKNIKVVDFEDVFHYAKFEYNVDWNTANDLFFDTILKCGNYTHFYPKYQLERCSHVVCKRYFSENNCDWVKAKEIPKEFVNTLCDRDKALVIIAQFFEDKKIMGEDTLVNAT